MNYLIYLVKYLFLFINQMNEFQILMFELSIIDCQTGNSTGQMLSLPLLKVEICT
jgi:hypothetical protein